MIENPPAEMKRSVAVGPLMPAEFEQVRRLAYEKFGLDLRKGKEDLVAARLSRNIRESHCGSFRDYFRHVRKDATGEALVGMIDALVTNHTWFLREPAHFDFLRDQVLPQLAGRPRIDIWSAACATGEEPYTIAFTVMEKMLPSDYGKLHILATDISLKALEGARRAIYSADRFSEFPKAWMSRFLLRGEGRSEGWYRIKPEVTGRVELMRVNLVAPLCPGRRFPLIFCRNVMIYFDKPTQRKLVNALTECLEPGGYLFVGHAESLAGIDHPLRYVRPAIYAKASAENGWRGRAGGSR